MSASITSASRTSSGSLESSASSSIDWVLLPESIRDSNRSIASSFSCSELDESRIFLDDFSASFAPSKREINSSLFPDIIKPLSLHNKRNSETFIEDSESRSRLTPPTQLTNASPTLGLSTPSAFRSVERGYLLRLELAETAIFAIFFSNNSFNLYFSN